MRRDNAGRIGQSQRIAMAARIRAHLDAHPDARIRDVCAATGASENMVKHVRDRWIYARERAAGIEAAL